MGPDINTGSILALGNQIEGSTGDVIQLKRSRKLCSTYRQRRLRSWVISFVGASSPLATPEGYKGAPTLLHRPSTFVRGRLGGSRASEFLGNNLHQWSRQCKLSGANAPIDLVLTYVTSHTDDTRTPTRCSPEGYKVVAVASLHNYEFLRDLGAGAVFDVCILTRCRIDPRC